MIHSKIKHLFVLACIPILQAFAGAQAQDNDVFGKVELRSSRSIVLVSLLKEGQLVKSTRINNFSRHTWSRVPIGKYRLRLESEGCKTIILPIYVDSNEPVCVDTTLTEGEGILYFGDNPTLEEIVQRIEALETAISDIIERLNKLDPPLNESPNENFQNGPDEASDYSLAQPGSMPN